MYAPLAVVTTRRFLISIIGFRSMGLTRLLTTGSFCAPLAIVPSTIRVCLLQNCNAAMLLTRTRIWYIAFANQRIGQRSKRGSIPTESSAKRQLKRRKLNLLHPGNGVAFGPHPATIFLLDRGGPVSRTSDSFANQRPSVEPLQGFFAKIQELLRRPLKG
jgi:hypothetical protein